MVALENQFRSTAVASKNAARQGGEQRENGRAGEKREMRSNPKKNRAVNKEELVGKMSC